MSTNPSFTSARPALTIQFHLMDGTVQRFVQADAASARQIWDRIDPKRIFNSKRFVIGSEHSKSVIISAETNRIDFVQDGFECWEFPGGYTDVVELSEEDFRKHARLDQPDQMARRAQATPAGDLLVSFLQLRMKGGQSLLVMIEFPVKLPVENQSFLQFMLSKGSFYMRLTGGGMGVVNLANLIAYTVYPGVAEIPSDSWLAEPATDRPEQLDLPSQRTANSFPRARVDQSTPYSE